MAKKHGKDTVVKVDGDDLSVYTNTSEFKPTTDTEDTTTYGADGHVYDAGLTDGEFSMGGFYDSTAATGPRAVLQPLKGAAAKVPVIRQPEGTGSGLPQDSFTGVMTSYVETNPVEGYIKWTASFKISGDVNSTAQSA
jgi:hypothetical protein